MAHVRREKVGTYDGGRGGDQVVDGVDSAVRPSVLGGHRTGQPDNPFIHRDPGERTDEQLGGVELVRPNVGEQLESAELTGQQWLALHGQSIEEFRGSVVAP